MFHKEVQGNFKRESSNLSEVNWGCFPGTPSFQMIAFCLFKNINIYFDININILFIVV